MLIAEFPKMVEWWVEMPKMFKGGSFAHFRKRFYGSWRKEWEGWHSQHAQTSCLVAYTVLQMWRKTGERTRGFGFRFSVISPRVVWIEGGNLCFSTRIGCTGCVGLFPRNKHQKMLLEQAELEKWRVGQTILTPKWSVVPFTRYLDLAFAGDQYIQNLLNIS